MQKEPYMPINGSQSRNFYN